MDLIGLVEIGDGILLMDLIGSVTGTYRSSIIPMLRVGMHPRRSALRPARVILIGYPSPDVSESCSIPSGKTVSTTGGQS
jgi:hypothetical protein